MMFLDHTGIKLDIKNRRVAGKFLTIWQSNSMLLNNTWVKENCQEKFLNILNSLKMKIKYQSLWNVAKAVLWGKCKDVSGKKHRSKLDNLSFYLGKLEKENKLNSVLNRIKEIKNRAKLNKIENRKLIEGISKTKSFSWKYQY